MSVFPWGPLAFGLGCSLRAFISHVFGSTFEVYVSLLGDVWRPSSVCLQGSVVGCLVALGVLSGHTFECLDIFWSRRCYSGSLFRMYCCFLGALVKCTRILSGVDSSVHTSASFGDTFAVDVLCLESLALWAHALLFGGYS